MNGRMAKGRDGRLEWILREVDVGELGEQGGTCL